MKTIIAYLFVASIMAISFVGFAKADGIDDPNIYQDFDYCFETSMQNNSIHCRKYDKLGIHDWSKERHKFIYIPDENDYLPTVKDSSTVPEPMPLLMIGTTIVAALIIKKIKE